MSDQGGSRLRPGQTIVHYQLIEPIGAGGMAHVYLARDLKHDRDVALKVLKEEIAASIGVDRFLAEIRTTARLKHPHILPLFDSGSADGSLFYVMPFVDGESLHARVRRAGPLPIADAVRILREIADALAYAHACGVVHRDIKADNVMLAGGHAFLADFGIARVFAVQDPGATATASAVAVGTPAYMAPEQIVGGAVDGRTDIYAFGALAYEALTGAPPFEGSSQDIAAAHLTRAPEPITRRRADVPSPIADLVMRCLEKGPERRPQRAEDLLTVLDATVQRDAPSSPSRASVTRTVVLVAAMLVVAALAIAWYFRSAEKTAAPTIARLIHVTTDPGLELDPVLSPDGRTLAYAAGSPGQTRIYIRELSGGRAVPLTENASPGSQRWPQWSPDGSSILFQASADMAADPSSITAPQATLYIAAPLSGSAKRLPIAPAAGAVGASWSPDSRRIVFATAAGLYSMRVDTTEPPRLLVAGYDLYSPAWSPDGTMIAYAARDSLFTFGGARLANVATSVVAVLALGTGRVTVISSGNTLDTNPAWMPDSRTLAFVSSRGGGRDIYTVNIAADGGARSAAVRLTSGASAHALSISHDGRLLVYSSYAPNANIWSIRIPEAGTVSVSEAEQVTFGNDKIEKLAVSRDGRWLAYDSDVNGPADIWKMPLGGGRPEQVTHGPFHKFVNDWSPDGREILYHSIDNGNQRDLFVVSADGTHTERVTSGPAEEQHAGWSPDGNSIVFDSAPQGSHISNAAVVTRAQRGAGWSAPRPLTKNGSGDPKWSPDGRLIAFCANGELRVIAPDGTGERAIVRPSGDEPQPEYAVWSRDGRTIYYKAYDRDRQSAIWEVPTAGGPPKLLVRFDVPARRSMRREFATDGRRFYFTVARDESDIWGIELAK
jgi:eukaryotic-like serine/threonine-protein kinase